MDKSFIYKDKELIHLLGQGSSMVLPTDTLPALAALPECAENLWNIKIEWFRVYMDCCTTRYSAYRFLVDYFRKLISTIHKTREQPESCQT